MARPRSKTGSKGAKVTFSCHDRIALDILMSIQRERRSSFIVRSVLYYASTPEGSEVVSFITNGEPPFRGAAAKAISSLKSTRKDAASEPSPVRNRTKLKQHGPFGAPSAAPPPGAVPRRDEKHRGKDTPGHGAGGKKPESGSTGEGVSGILGDFEGNE